MAKVRLRNLRDQVIVITGASSGIGLATAKRAAERGAVVVLVARNERALIEAARQIRAAGGTAAHVVADVADAGALERAAELAAERYGRIDSWVNCAAVAIYGRVEEIPLADMRRLFDVNFWGTVHGCNAALPFLRVQGGALINVGSVVSERAMPLLGAYTAAKHAVKGYTDALRMELEHDGAPVSVTLIKPASVDTPFFRHSRSYLGVEPLPVPPVYAPGVVADAILSAAERPTRDLVVGGGGRALITADHLAPRMTDRAMEASFFGLQRSDVPIAGDRRDNLYEPLREDGAERGNYEGHVMESSAYTAAARRPVLTTLALAGLGIVAAGALAAIGDSLPRAARRRSAGHPGMPRLARRARPAEVVVTETIVIADVVAADAAPDAERPADDPSADRPMRRPTRDSSNALDRDNLRR